MTAMFHVGDAIEVWWCEAHRATANPPLESSLCDRVLAPHGSLCVELGDTYAGSGGGGGDYTENGLRAGQPKFEGSEYAKRLVYGREDGTSGSGRRHMHDGAWPLAKSLSLIPELFRLTLVYGTNPLTGRTTDRWRLRNVVRWVRPNPPVGALGDKFRPATSELMVFCKSAKRYFDLDAVREPHATVLATTGKPVPRSKYPNGLMPSEADGSGQDYRRGESDQGHHRYAPPNPAGAPPLDWWNIPPGGYEGAHYAVFPPELCIKPIKAMSPERVCRQCGEPSRRIVEKAPEYAAARAAIGDFNSREPGQGLGGSRSVLVKAVGRDITSAEHITLGWTDCGHDDWRPGLILDPFVGSGTTLMVATGHGRDAIGIDLDSRNFDLALHRVGPLIMERAEI